MQNNIKHFVLTMAGVIGLWSFQAEAATKQCLKGKEPTQKEVMSADFALIEHRQELYMVSLSKSKGSKRYRKQCQEFLDLEVENNTKAMEIYSNTILPPLNSCSELTMSLNKLKNLQRKWHSLCTAKLLNRDYIYNMKLLNNLITSKEKSTQ